MKKNYIVDTNVLLEDSEALKILINGVENHIWIPDVVLDELDGLKKNSRLKWRALDSIKKINEYSDNISTIDKNDYLNDKECDSVDDCIILATKYLNQKEDNVILVTNDEMIHFKCSKLELNCEKYLKCIPFQTESEKYTGFNESTENLIHNSFYWKEGKLIYHKNKNSEEIIDYDNMIWKIKPKDKYQNAAMTLLLDEDLDLISIQSEAGFGKTYLALAAALHWTLEKSKFKKIIVIKPNVDVGQEKLGFLPGDVKDKIWPYFVPIHELLLKLHEIRPANKLFKEKENTDNLNERKIEFAPINFMRGRNIENSFVIIDEFQNFSRIEARTLLSRMGENVKCICTGDIRQIDSIHLTEENNALNWIVKLCKDQKNYAHITLKGTKSRGPIADLVRKVKL